MLGTRPKLRQTRNWGRVCGLLRRIRLDQQSQREVRKTGEPHCQAGSVQKTREGLLPPGPRLSNREAVILYRPVRKSDVSIAQKYLFPTRLLEARKDRLVKILEKRQLSLFK